MLTLLVLADPADRALAGLERLPEGTRIVAGREVAAFRDAAPEADAILFWSAPPELLREVLALAPRVRWVHAASAGVENILFSELIESPAVLTNARGVYSAALAEFALAAILFFAKDLGRMMRAQAAGIWEPFETAVLEGATLGIVGYGDIGRAVAERARALGMNILALRRHPEESTQDPLIARTFHAGELNRMLGACDYVVVCAPLTRETRHLLGETELRAMPAEAVLVNIGRGPVVDEAALIAALRERRIRGAALDVFEREPLPSGHPLYSLENALISPHSADHTRGWRQRSLDCFLENFSLFRRGLPLQTVVDKRRGY